MKKTIDKQTATYYQWGDKCDSWVLADTEGLSVKQEAMPPGTKENLHFHVQAQQFFFILKGVATFYLNGEKIEVEELQGFHILPGTNHFIANETENSIEFLVISQPTTNNDRTITEA